MQHSEKKNTVLEYLYTLIGLQCICILYLIFFCMSTEIHFKLTYISYLLKFKKIQDSAQRSLQPNELKSMFKYSNTEVSSLSEDLTHGFSCNIRSPLFDDNSIGGAIQPFLSFLPRIISGNGPK